MSLAGLVAAAGALIWALRDARSPLELIGLRRGSPLLAGWVPFGAILGFGLGVTCRSIYGHGTLPGPLTPFVLVAVLIGSTEELVYRGCIQGVMRPWGGNLPIQFAACAHAAYKTALFAMPRAGEPVNYLFLFLATYVVGCVLGGLRHLSKSLLPAIALHAVFDIIVYGDRLQAPWWVWA